MAFEIGTADHAADLLLKLEKFLTTNPALVAAGQQWESLKDNKIEPYSEAYDMNALDKFVLQRCFLGRGIDGQDRIYVPMGLYISKPQASYVLTAYLARTWTPSVSIRNQFRQDYTIQTTIALWEKPIPYWFFANGRRFMIVAKVGSTYMSMYCGFVLPCATDREYPYPHMVAGSTNKTNGSYTATDIKKNGSFWIPVEADYYSSEASSSIMVSPEGRILYGSSPARGVGLANNVEKFVLTPYVSNLYQGKTYGDDYVLSPIGLYQINYVYNMLGWLDGAFYVSGFENSPENILTVDGVRYICFPSSVGNSYNDWCAIRME